MRLVWAGVALLPLLVGAARAERSAASSTQAELEALQGQISDPQDFKNYVEGSRRLPEGPAVPSVTTWQGRSAAGASLRNPSRPRWLRPEEALPSPSAARSAAGQTPGHVPSFPLPAGVALFSVAVAVGLVLSDAASRCADSSPAAPAAEPFSAAATAAASPAAMELDIPQPEALPASVRVALARAQMPPEPFVDTRMPVPTWRAISLREQQLIEGWDASAEKAAGRAGLSEWLAAQDGVKPAEAAFLQAKLEREA